MFRCDFCHNSHRIATSQFPLTWPALGQPTKLKDPPFVHVRLNTEGALQPLLAPTKERTQQWEMEENGSFGNGRYDAGMICLVMVEGFCVSKLFMISPSIQLSLLYEPLGSRPPSQSKKTINETPSHGLATNPNHHFSTNLVTCTVCNIICIYS